MNETDLLRDQAAQARRLVVDMAGSAVGCHLGGSLSVNGSAVDRFLREKSSRSQE